MVTNNPKDSQYFAIFYLFASISQVVYPMPKISPNFIGIQIKTVSKIVYSKFNSIYLMVLLKSQNLKFSKVTENSFERIFLKNVKK